MSLYRELLERLPFDPTEREGLWGYRRAEQPQAVRASVALGAVVAIGLATGFGLAAPIDWGAAFFCGLAIAVLARGVFLAQHRLRHGGWRAWRQRQVNERAVDQVSGGLGIALVRLLASGGGGIGPAFAIGEALFAGIIAIIVGRAALLLIRWP